MRTRRTLMLATALLALGGGTAWAQVTVGTSTHGLTIEGFANLTAGRDAGADRPFSSVGGDGRLDGAVRLIGLVKTQGGISFGPRVILQSAPDDKFGLGERSLLLQGRWGRSELGYRQGLPDVLIGYPPNSFTFTGAEYGPATGPGLDPDGRLPSAFLDPALATQIDAMSYLGFGAALYLDQSPKLIYVSPRKRGFLAGAAFAPNVEDRYGPFDELVQTGLVYEGYSESHIFRLGATYTHAAGREASVTRPATADLDSVSGGATVVLRDRLILGASLTYDGRNGRDHARAKGASEAFGYSASVNYNVGPWTFGGYYQAARAEGDATIAGQDHLNVLQVGGSYRFERRLRLFGAAYLYRFRDEARDPAGKRSEGAVFLVGLRATL